MEGFPTNSTQLQAQFDPIVTTQNLSDLMKIPLLEFNKYLADKFGGVLKLCHDLHTSPSIGLNDDKAEIERRRRQFGSNEIAAQKPDSFCRLILNALKEPTLIILEVAAVISIAISIWSVFRPEGNDPGDKYEWIEGLAIILAVSVIVLVTAANDYGKEKQFRKLQEKVTSSHKVAVLRGGTLTQIPSKDLVVGDVCVLKYGDMIPADGVILQSHGLRVDESSLTGESKSNKKSAEKDNKLLSGTAVMEGSGRMLVLAVGGRSQCGSISVLLGASVPSTADHGTANGSSIGLSFSVSGDSVRTITEARQKNKSVLQEKLQVLAARIGKVGMILGFVTSFVLILRFCVQNYGIKKNGWNKSDIFDLLDAVIMGITVLVVAIPEGLPLAVTLTLAVAGKKMMTDHNLVRHLFACETMGCATTICSDKTGTLTTNRMTVTSTLVGGHLTSSNPYHTKPWLINPIPKKIMDELALNIAINSSYSSNVFPVANKVSPGQDCVASGNSTDCALLTFVQSSGCEYQTLRSQHPEENFLRAWPFDSGRKFMATVIKDSGGFRVLVKGAPEVILGRCNQWINNQYETDEFSPELREEALSRISTEMAANGLRTISLASKLIQTLPDGTADDEPNTDNILTNLTYLGTFGIEDPIRPEVPSAVLQCAHAGITVRMVTGDNKETAKSVALKCGIISQHEDITVAVLDSTEFNRLIKRPDGTFSQDRFNSVWPRLRVLARSTPEDKYNLVEGIINSRITENQEVVAVTGDGTNDAPALKKADVGFAMGIAGTDIAKEASDIIITDDNFISIVKACTWGRNIYENIGKFLQFQLTTNVGATGITIIAVVILGVTPIKAVPMLWINLIADTLASLALATEPPSLHLLDRKPHGRKKSVLSSIMVRNIVGQGLYQLIVLSVLLFAGEYILNPADLQRTKVMGPNHGLYTLIFNAFAIMSLFNLINCRCVENERNIFARITKNAYFLGLWCLMFVIQILVVQFGGFAFNTTGLSWRGWLISFFAGFGSWTCYQVLVFVPARYLTGLASVCLKKSRIGIWRK